MPIKVKEETEVASLPHLPKKVQASHIHIQKNSKGKPIKVIIHKGAGLKGGSDASDSEDDNSSEEDEGGSDYYNEPSNEEADFIEDEEEQEEKSTKKEEDIPDSKEMREFRDKWKKEHTKGNE